MKKVYIILALVLTVLFSVDVYGAGCPTLTMSSLTSKEVSAIRSACKDINRELYEKRKKTGITTDEMQMLTCSKDESSPNTEGYMIENIELNITLYNGLNQKEKEGTMEIMLNGVENSDLSQINKSRLYNFISNGDEATSQLFRQLSADVGADYAGVYHWLRKFWRPLNIVLGCMVWFMFLALGIVIAMDIAYITLPMFQLWVETGIARDEAAEKKKRVHLSVSEEARFAVKQAESTSGSGYREPLGTYFGLKTKQLMALAVCILYLISGDIYKVIGSGIDMFIGFVK